MDARAVRTSTRSNARPANSREFARKPPLRGPDLTSHKPRKIHTHIDRNEWNRNHPAWIDSTRRRDDATRRDATRGTYLGRRRRGGFRGFAFSANARGSAGRVRRLRDDGNGTSGKHVRAQSYDDPRASRNRCLIDRNRRIYLSMSCNR